MKDRLSRKIFTTMNPDCILFILLLLSGGDPTKHRIQWVMFRYTWEYPSMSLACTHSGQTPGAFSLLISCYLKPRWLGRVGVTSSWSWEICLDQGHSWLTQQGQFHELSSVFWSHNQCWLVGADEALTHYKNCSQCMRFNQPVPNWVK